MIKILLKISALFYKIHRIFFVYAKKLQRPSLPLSEINKERWLADNKEKTLRYQYELSENSTVIDVGAYEGDFASEIAGRFQCKVYAFEPVAKYVQLLNERFKHNPKIIILPKGLGAKNEKISINVMDEASSLNRTASIHKKGKEEIIEVMDVCDFFKEYSIGKAGLIKINIEGAEYDLLDKMIENNLHLQCENLQIQFHDFYPDYQNRYNKIKNKLEDSHVITYKYDFVWENWKLK